MSNSPLSVAEVADILDTNRRTVLRLIERGQLKARKAHDGLRAPFLITPDDLDRYREQRDVA